LLGASAALSPFAAGHPGRSDFAIVRVKVEDGLGQVRERATVVVRAGIIESIGSETPPADLLVIDGSGKTLYPGFIDAFSTRGLRLPAQTTASSAQSQATSQARPVRPGADTTAHGSMWEANRKGIAPEWRAVDNLDYSPGEREIRSGVTAVLLCSPRGSLRGQPAVLAASPASDTGRVLASSVGQAASFRIGVGPGYPGNILGSIALLRQTFADAQSLRDGARLWPGDAKPAWAASLEALQPVLEGRDHVFFEANLAREILRAIAIADEFGLRLVIVGGREAGFVADELARRKIAVVLTHDLGPEPTEGPQGAPPADRQPQAYFEERRAAWLKAARSAETLFGASVPVAFSSEGSDSGLLAAVRARIARGMDRDKALEALTMGAATILGIDRLTGSVSVGKRADLTLMSGDFADPTVVIERVWVGGVESKMEAKP
jgi:imidazolonepropionase-like amidohydrolase